MTSQSKGSCGGYVFLPISSLYAELVIVSQRFANQIALRVEEKVLRAGSKCS